MKKDETFITQTLYDVLGNIEATRPVYIICDGRRYRLIEVKDRVLDRVELIASEFPEE